MSSNFFYYEIVKRTAAAFGTLFNDIYIRHQTEEGEDYSYIKVPLAYGPIQKFLARIEQKPDLRNRVALTLPRMSFQIGKLSYDASRKASSTQSFKVGVGPNNIPGQVYLPVPYILPFELSIATKNEDDMLQIVEQILPTFKPEYTLSVNLTPTIGDVKDIPIVLQDISPFQDNYEGNYDTRRFIECTLTFNAKIAFYGALPSNANSKLIKKVQVDYYTNTEINKASRQLRYIVTPKAIKDYDDDNITTIAQDLTQVMTEFQVSDSSPLVEKTYIQINDEVMFIESINNNEIKVTRGKYSTPIQEHVEGDAINAINSADDEMIQITDEFDFNEEYFNFGDGKIFSPSKGVDV